MASKKTKFTVGLFLVIGLVIAVFTIIWLGMSNYFEKGRRYAAYFDESIQGLDKDSSVKYRGVPIGRVHRIGVAQDSRFIEVILNIESLEIETDMIAELKSVGITGLMFIEIDRKKERELQYPLPAGFKPKYPVIRTKPSGMKNLLDGMNHIRDFLRELEAGQLSDRFRETMEKLDIMLDTVGRVLGGADRIISTNEKNIRDTISDLRSLTKNADNVLAEGEALMKYSNREIEGLRNSLVKTLANLETAGEKLNDFIDIISDQPSQLVFGEPPASRKIEPKKR